MLYITYDDLECAGYMGIKKKVLAQVEALRKDAERIYYTCYYRLAMYLMDGRRIVEKKATPTRKERSEVLIQWLDKYNIQKTYIRYHLADRWFLQLLRFQKERGIRSVIEIPTYPYDAELESGRMKSEDAYFRRQLREYAGMLATYSDDSEIWGIPCIKLRNGIDLEDNKISVKKKQDGKLVLLAVSSMAFWNGYERLLEGLGIYYLQEQAIEVKLKFVGEGPEESYYKALTDKYGLWEHVEFCGKLTGKELDNVYDQSDIAVSSLGAYKKHMHTACPLKGGEYCARGIPFICGYTDSRFPETLDFVMSVPNNEEPININDVLRFYDNATSKRDYRKTMRDYAEKHLAWESIMRPVTDYLLENEESADSGTWKRDG